MSIGNTSLHQSGEIPEIVKLPNGRIRVTRRFHKFTREDIDNANLGSLMGDFGDLDTAGEQISNQGYTNCRLISVEVDPSFRFNSVSNTDSAVLVKTYETLTDSFVQITDDTVTFTDNGLKQITRVYRAVSGTTSSNVVGTTALNTGETLASSRIEDSKAFAELTETYIESGVLSRTTDLVGSQNAITVEVFNPSEIPSPVSNFFYIQPDGTSLYLQPDDVSLYLQIEGEISHLLANVQESNVDGIPTKRYTFLKPSILSQSEDKVGSQLAITIEAFGEVPATPAGYSLARTDVSDFEGIKTNRYTFLEPSILSVSTPKVGGQQRVQVQAFNLSEATVVSEVSEVTASHELVDITTSDVEGIPTRNFTFDVDNFDVRSTTDNGLLTITRTDLGTVAYSDGNVGTDTITDGAITLYLAGEEIDNGNTIKKRVTRWAEAGTISESKTNGPTSLPSTIVRSIRSIGAAPTSNGILLNKTLTNVGGLITYDYQFLEKANGTSPTSGDITTYETIIEVRKAGTVNAVTANETAVLQVVPPSIAKVKATVTVSLTTSNTATLPVAFNLDNTSCSAVLSETKVTPLGMEQGNIIAVVVKNVRRNASIRTFPNHYRLNSVVSEIRSTPYSIVRDNDNIIGESLNEVITTSVSLSGSSTAPATTGVYDEQIEPAFFSDDGTQYYRKTTFTI
jgi:hypothetical protein